jgi:VWFA-related protein
MLNSPHLYIRARCLLLSLSLFLVAGITGITDPGLGAQKRPAVPSQDQEPLKLGATLVQIPAIVTDRSGGFVTDLSRKDFTVFEDGKRQEIALFAALKQPFQAVLVLDTSNSAEDRLRVIQNCAITFAGEIEPGDRLMVISFDNEIRQLTDFTSDRTDIESAIRAVESGYGKLLYEAVAQGLEQLKDVEGRRAVILFTDGVDLGSISATSESTLRRAEEIGAVIYVVRFETRWWIESAARRQKAEHPQSKLPISIDGRIPLPPEFGGPDPTPPGMPRAPRIEINSRPTPPVVIVDGKRQEPAPGPQDEVTKALDQMYGKADEYLLSLSSGTGGVVFRAENFDETQSAFRAIAEEIRRQYLLGYYLANDQRDARYHKVKVEVARKGLRVRSRSGYRR